MTPAGLKARRAVLALEEGANGMDLLGVASLTQSIVTGLVLLLAATSTPSRRGRQAAGRA